MTLRVGVRLWLWLLLWFGLGLGLGPSGSPRWSAWPQDGAPLQASSPLIVPPSAKTAPGGANNSIPFSWKPVRYQQIIAPEAFGFEGTLLLGGLRFRCDTKMLQQAQGEVDLEIVLATLPEGRRESSKVFAENLGKDRLVVVPRQSVEVRGSDERQEPDQDPLAIWDLRFVFTRPFKYRTDRHLVIEVTVFGNDHGNGVFTFPMDAVQGSPQVNRLYAGLGEEQGDADRHGLVVCFDVLARAAAPVGGGGVGAAASRAASRAASVPESRPAK